MCKSTARARETREASQRQKIEKHLHPRGTQGKEMRQRDGQGHVEAREAGGARVK